MEWKHIKRAHANVERGEKERLKMRSDTGTESGRENKNNTAKEKTVNPQIKNKNVYI